MVNGSKKSDSSAADLSGSRRSTRSQNNSSPNLRKSNRLEGRSPASTPALKKKPENPSPLRKSVKDNKSSPSSKGSKQDLTLKEIAMEVRGQGKPSSSSEDGSTRVKRLDARRYREMFKPLKKPKSSELETVQKRKMDNSDASGDSDPDDAEDGRQKHSDGEKTEGDGAGSNPVVNDNASTDKPCEVEDGDDNLPSTSPSKEVVEKSDKTEETVAVIEKLPTEETHLALDNLSHDSSELGCNEKGVISGPSAIEKEGTDTCPVDANSSYRTDVLSEECAKCFRKRSLDRDSPEQELCCCLSNNVIDMDGFKDRGQCRSGSAEFSDEHGQHVKQNNSSLVVCRSICDACQRTGKLLHCCGKGCSKSYHPSCSLNPEKDIYLSNWYCSECTKKRFAFGVHSVCQGVESIFDVRDVEMSTKGRLKQKQYFVKFKGLAHIHNRWLPEMQLLQEVAELHAQDTQWNPVWAVPHRLLLRRLVVIDDAKGVILDPIRQHEWLVKWCGLDYDLATWESEEFLCSKSPKAQQLIKEYETRHSKAKNNEIQEKRKGPHVKLGRHLVGGAESFVNKLREWHYKGQNAILLDEQDRLLKMIYLVSSLVASVSRPFLIIAPRISLPSWEAEFTLLASSINVVVYEGNADARDIIRTVEFFEGGHVMFQVLLSSAEVIDEDSEMLKGIEWEAVIIDDCQQSCILAHSGAIMNLATGWRLLLINSQIEEDVSEYVNILSLLEPGYRNLNEEINLLKDKLSSFITSARFVEFWVPVEMSNLQLEQYCYSIWSKLSVLKSISKSDPVGSLREILISLRKCCDHPYIVDMQLQTSLAYGLPYDSIMDLGIKASGKLYLLDELLSELKKQGLKVLILFQPAGGSGRDSTGSILDDYLRFRFGSDSYEHVESGLVSSKKQTACNQFNSVKERSFLLLETRACSPTIKLSLVDAVIIFNSDWNPLNDLRALQKLTIDSKIEQIKVFRLYCPGTVEEKVLILAKNDVLLDSNLQITNPSTRHTLLMWGSSYLFSRLHKFHQNNSSDCKDNIVFESSLSLDVTKEIVSLFQNRNHLIYSNNISVAQQNGGCYLKDIPVIGEKRIQTDDGVLPHIFWTNLLEGLKPQWKYLSGSSQRNRKRVQYNEEFSSEIRSDESSKRRKKTDTTKIDSSPLQAEPGVETSIINSQLKANTDPNPNKDIGQLSVLTNGTVIAELDELKTLHTEQMGLFESLKPTMLKLCEALLLKDDGKRFIEQFLNYLVKNYRVTKEPETRLQAFLLSVCWTAIEGLKKKIDHKKSIAIVEERLGFACTESEAEDIYTKLKPIFSCSGIANQHFSGDISPSNAENSFEKHRKKVEKVCSKKMEKLKVTHDEELKKIEKYWEDERLKLENWCKVESAAINHTLANSSVRTDKLRALDNDYARKREDLERKISISFKELEARQQVEREEEQKKIAGFMERIKSLEKSPDAKNGINSDVTDPVGPRKEPNESMCNNDNIKTPANAADAISSQKRNENTDNHRDNCNIDDSINALENIAMANGAVTITCPPEQPCACTGEAEKDANPVTAVVEEMLPLSSPNQSIPNTNQVLGAESHIGVEQVSNAIRTNNSSTLQESSPLDGSNYVASNLQRTGEMHNSTECSLDECNIVALNSSRDGQLNDNHTSMGATAASMHPDHSSSNFSGAAFSQHYTQLTVNQSVGTNHVPLVVSPHFSLPNPSQPPFTSISRIPTSHSDPLQLELARIHDEMTKVMNHHDQTKSQLKSECDKEIEEVVAQVRKKYEKKVDEAEASFLLKRNELEMCQHKVMMNKKLAEAFRSKCTDYKAAPKIPQIGISSSSMESSRSHYARPFPVTGSLTNTPVSGPVSTASAVQGMGSTTPLATQSRMASINPGVALMAGQQQQVRREAVAPSSPIQALSYSRSALMVPQRNNPASTSVMHLPSQSNPHGRLQREGSLGRGTMLSHLSNTELLRDITRLNDASLRQHLSSAPSFPDNVPTSETGDVTQSEGPSHTQPLSSSLPNGDVVCLSDDE